MEEYMLFYGDKKIEDNICITNMFNNTRQINLGWTDFDNNNNLKIIEEIINLGTNQIIFLGLEIGWDKLIIKLKQKYNNLKIRIICNTQDSLLYYDYERENFFKLLELSKKNIINNIAFLKKGQYEVYNSLGYNCSYLMQNYILDSNNKQKIKEPNNIIDIGIYPLNYTWDKNIFNQLCIGKMIKNCNINYNILDERMKDFLNTMKIQSKEDKINEITEQDIIQKVIKNDINISCSFTEYFHTIFWTSMEQGVPCIIGNTSDLFDKDNELKNYIVTLAEDNPIENAKKVEECLKNKDKVIQLYKNWKEEYNKKAKENIQAFINK